MKIKTNEHMKIDHFYSEDVKWLKVYFLLASSEKEKVPSERIMYRGMVSLQMLSTVREPALPPMVASGMLVTG